TPWLIEKYKKTRKDSGRSNQTVNLELACLKTLFSKAILWGKATENPVKQVRLFRVNNTRVRVLDEGQEERLLERCQEHLLDLVVTALQTGFRRNELLNLTVEDADFIRGIVWVQAGYAKNGEARSVPMTNTLRTILQRLVQEAGTNE